ncbi:hypothetical protein CMO93_00570 [Candidatus Woesearchaeota archaeon]|nr:hypothetical protein [Candidatus Woesearchaeota archaeon]|tara:strand:+ start:33720 stop:34049 length:330 start_codon:yes stop_codon:yes gene_type:complete
MIKIEILNDLRYEIFKTFKKDSLKVYNLIEELKENPNKGKVLGHVGNISIRELKYKSFRFYFILDGHKLNLFNKNKLEELLIKFIEMSKKHNQQKTIEKIKEILKRIKN